MKADKEKHKNKKRKNIKRKMERTGQCKNNGRFMKIKETRRKKYKINNCIKERCKYKMNQPNKNVQENWSE